MTKQKSRGDQNPGLESTIVLEKGDVLANAAAFGDAAISLALTLNPHADPRLNVIFTNGALALELYFKAQLVEKIVEPAYFEMTDEGEQRTTEEQYWNQDTVVLTILHSRLEVPKIHQTHDLVKLYKLTNESFKSTVFAAASKNSENIKTQDDLIQFLTSINRFFVRKRYAFEGFISGVEVDKIYLYTLIPLLKSMKSALL